MKAYSASLGFSIQTIETFLIIEIQNKFNFLEPNLNCSAHLLSSSVVFFNLYSGENGTMGRVN